MFTITKLKMWKDPKYTRQCLEVPPPGSWKLPAPDYTSSEDLRPRRGSTLSQIELPLSYIQVFDMSYLYIEAKDSATPTPHTISLFGWILSIEEIASSNDVVRITWTPDYWRTYAGSATFKNGVITRCNDASHKRPFPISPRFWKLKHYEKLITYKYDPTIYDTTYPYWICISYNLNRGGKTVTTTLFWQCNKSAGKQIYDSDTHSTLDTMSLSQVLSGMCEECLGLITTSINSIYISPIQPYNAYNSTGIGGLITPHSFGGKNYTCFIKLDSASPITSPVYFNNAYETNDLLKAVIVDPYGAVVASVPWGMKINIGSLGLDCGTTLINLMGHFEYSDTLIIPAPMNNLIEGRCISAPLLNAPINSNALGDYVLSGQLEYDKQFKEIQRTEQKSNGYLSAGTSALGGAVAGGMATSNPGGAVAGALIGEIGSALTTDLRYQLEGKYNDAYQALTNNLYSNQGSNLLQSAGGDLFLSNLLALKEWYIVQLEGDSVSQEEYSDEISLNGYETEIPTSSVSSYITTGGPLRINNLTITGSIPPEAKTYIKNILSNGVRIVENNPSGVVP